MSERTPLLIVTAFLFICSACNVLQDDVYQEESTALQTSVNGDQVPDWLADAPDDLMKVSNGPGGLTVMTRNLYIGTDVAIVLTAETPEQIPVLAAQAFQTLLATDFPARAHALAEEIAETQPHLVGIQEATTIRVQSPGDAIIGGTTAAQDVLFDYLDILLQALQSRGLNYHVAGSVQNADVELPYLAGTDPLRFNDLRVTDYDVILARHDVQISRAKEATLGASLAIPELGITIPRGYVAVDATVLNRTYRVVNTHLEPFSLPVQLAQARELISVLENEKLPLVLLGDFNTAAPTGDTYQLLLSEGYLDVWTLNRKPHSGDGFTCCHVADLSNPVSVLDERIDLILFKSSRGVGASSGLGAVFATVVGDEPEDRLPSGLWPSDHAGVVAAMRIPASNNRAGAASVASTELY